MDLSNGSMCEDNKNDEAEAVPCTPAPKLTQSSMPNQRSVHRDEYDLDSTMPRTVTTEFAQHALDVAVMQVTLEYLDTCQLDPDDLTDTQLKTYIEFIIDTKYYERNLRSKSVESQSSDDSSHSR